MNIKLKHCALAALLSLCSASLVSCSDDDDKGENGGDNNQEVTISDGVFVVNAGNYFGNINGSLSYIDFETGKVSQEVFLNANGRNLGANPVGGVLHGDKFYIAVQVSNVIEVVDRKTLKVIKQIPCTSTYGTEPRSITAREGKVYVAMNDGYVARIDTLSLSFDATVKVGPNPDQIAIAGKYLYTVNSDGNNYMNGYENGKTASKIDLDTFTELKKINVGLNPTRIVSNGTDIYIIAMGNYADIPATVQRIKADDTVTDVCPGTRIAINGDKLYVLNAPVSSQTQEYLVYNAADPTLAPKKLADVKVDSPESMDVDPSTGDLFVTSFVLDNGYADYYNPGYVSRYNADGKFVAKYDTGIDPYSLVFDRKTVVVEK